MLINDVASVAIWAFDKWIVVAFCVTTALYQVRFQLGQKFRISCIKYDVFGPWLANWRKAAKFTYCHSIAKYPKAWVIAPSVVNAITIYPISCKLLDIVVSELAFTFEPVGQNVFEEGVQYFHR